MSLNPFIADRAIADRHADQSAAVGEVVAQRVVATTEQRRDTAQNLGGVVLREEAEALIAEYGLSGIEDLMLLCLPAARRLADPPISEFFVGAVGLEAETGNLLLGGNLEFPGSHLGYTVHGEGFVFMRAFSRGTSVKAIALGEAHPCAHCRQLLSEFAATRELTLIDTMGHRLTMGQLYPWPFDPAYLGESGAMPEKINWPHLSFEGAAPNGGDMLLAAGRRAYTPYSRCPSAIALQLRDGRMIAGSPVESVAFNPSMHPLPAALIDLRAHGYRYLDIVAATLGKVAAGSVDLERSTSELLHSVAPHATLQVAVWSVGR